MGPVAERIPADSGVGRGRNAALVSADAPQPSFSLEAEMSVLGGMLIDGDAVGRVTAQLEARDFYREAHCRLFKAMVALWKSGAPVEPVGLAEQLRAAGDFEATGGAAYLAELWDYVPSAANIEYHCGIVRRRSLERRIQECADALARDPANGVAYGILSETRAALEEAGAPAPRFRPYTDLEIEDLPEPEQQIDGMLLVNSLTVLVGAPEAGKTFLALDWALCISTGLPWCGRSVKRGGVLYVAAEGTGGLGKRIRAWKRSRHQFGSTGARFVTVPVAMLDAVDQERFVREAIRTLPEPPALVVLDTLNRTFGSGDENSTSDMGRYIKAADRLREETGATVLIVHHTGWDQSRERGNTSLRGAADTMMLLKSEDDRLSLTCTKMKDLPHFPTIELQRAEVAESCAIVPARGPLQSRAGELNDRQRKILALLQTHFLATGATASEWLKASEEKERTFYKARTDLVAMGYVHEPEKPRGGRYTITDAGADALTASCNDAAN